MLTIIIKSVINYDLPTRYFQFYYDLTVELDIIDYLLIVMSP